MGLQSRLYQLYLQRRLYYNRAKPLWRESAAMARDGRRSAVLLDEYPLWLEAVERVLKNAGLDVVGKTTDPDDALALVEEHAPDLLVAEIALTGDGIDGIECVRCARNLAPDLKTVVLSSCKDEYAVRAALAVGAVAYVVKTAQPEDLASAVRQAFDHSVYLPGDLALEAVAAEEAKNEEAPKATTDVEELTPRETTEAEELTPRERQILRLVAEGRSNADVANRLWVTEQTVKVHLSKIYRKLGVSNRTEASRRGQLKGLLE